MIHGIIINFLRGDYHIVLRKLRKVFRGKLSWKLEIILKYFGRHWNLTFISSHKYVTMHARMLSLAVFSESLRPHGL